MKRFLAVICCAAVLFAAGCGYSASEKRMQEDSFELYFRELDLTGASGADALRAEQVVLANVPEKDTEAVAVMLMEKLLAGPEDPTLRSPFPTGTALNSLEVKGGRAKVDLSPAYQTLSGVGLTLADYAITLTLSQLPEISVVSITVHGRELAYRNAQSFSARDVLLSTTEDVVGTVTATLYFLNETDGLTASEMVLDLYEGDTQVGAVVAALERKPQERGLSSAFPAGFRVKSVWLEEGICYVNLSTAELSELTEQRPAAKAVQAVVQSLLSLDGVEEVRFLVDGEFAQYYGKVPVSESYH